MPALLRISLTGSWPRAACYFTANLLLTNVVEVWILVFMVQILFICSPEIKQPAQSTALFHLTPDAGKLTMALFQFTMGSGKFTTAATQSTMPPLQLTMTTIIFPITH
jgi:hypothetical protein